MSTRIAPIGRILCACIALGTAALPCAALHAGEDYREAQRLRQSGQILPLETIVQRAKAVHQGKLLDIELEREDGRYVTGEVKRVKRDSDLF